ncbi:hypothetical protein ACTHPH_03550 [Paenibacillus pasadenensis]|uniref:hypothetical protein n=1 Tax=Paenibacillus pasadenensis TaxID=217090 RepID=UPI000426179C|nr:hypothetical protein [Paenibacillus pasadenensis]
MKPKKTLQTNFIPGPGDEAAISTCYAYPRKKARIELERNNLTHTRNDNFLYAHKFLYQPSVKGIKRSNVK